MLDKTILKKFPLCSGVYLFKDGKGKILYTGKAKNLKKRISSYFRETANPKIPAIIRNSLHADYILTTTEKEALILECSIIKKYKPRYNVTLKDDKNYFNLKVNVNETFPSFVLTREVKNDGSTYFGPYTSASSLRLTLKLIRSMFRIRNCCHAKFRQHKKLPCMEYQIGRCSAPCCGYISREDYLSQVYNSVLFLNGRNDELLKILKDKMMSASKGLNYEYAARLRDSINSVSRTVEQQKVLKYFRHDADIIAIVPDIKKSYISMLFVRGGRLIGNKDFTVKNYKYFEEGDLISFLNQYYSSGKFIPDEIVMSMKIRDVNLIGERLSDLKGGAVDFTFPQRGEKKGLVEMAVEKAKNNLKQAEIMEEEDKAILTELKNSLKLPFYPELIQCCDISSLSGMDAVGSVVTFKNGRPFKEGYRRYKIRTSGIHDDIGMMYEVLSRHFKKMEYEKNSINLFIVDGGKGHLNAALQASKERGFPLNIISVAKYRLKGKKLMKTSSSEDIFLPGKKDPLHLKDASKALLLIKHIRDEAHRFAVTYHSKVRGRHSATSVLDNVDGIGIKRKNILLKVYKSVDDILSEDIEKLARLPGFNLKVAEEVKKYLLENKIA